MLSVLSVRRAGRYVIATTTEPATWLLGCFGSTPVVEDPKTRYCRLCLQVVITSEWE